ncbi:MAG: hypothetical protein AAF467_27665 [Actinomycetota bacterium]
MKSLTMAERDQLWVKTIKTLHGREATVEDRCALIAFKRRQIQTIEAEIGFQEHQIERMGQEALAL